MTSTVKTSIILTSCAVAALVSRPALAQSVANADVRQSSPAVAEEIVVTAQKRSENILNVPAGVSIVSTKLLDEVHATQLTDVSAYVPAFNVDSTGSAGQTTITIRGIAPVGRGSTVATYIDDTPVGSSSSYGGGNAFQLDLLPYDVQRFEILRGPQGTLYGASSMGGLLKYVLTTPSLTKFAIRAGGDLMGVQGGGSAGGGARINVSGPILADQLGFVASYALEHTPGFIDNAVTGQRGQNAVTQQSVRLGLYWKASNTLSIKLNGLYQRVKADGDANIALDDTTLQPIYGNRQNDNLTPEPFIKTIKLASATVDYKGDRVEVVSATSYADTHTSQTQDASYTYGVAFPFFGLPAGESSYSYLLHLKKFTQEVRAQSAGEAPLQWTIGGFYTSEISSNFQSPSALTLAGASIPGLDPLFIGNLPSTYREYAFFGDLNYRITRRLEVFGGVRYAKNHQMFSEIGSGPLVGTIDLENQRSSEGVTTYSAGTRYKPTERTTLYFRVASGYRPGGPNLAVQGVPPTFKSDTLTNYEVGVKAQSANSLIAIDAAAFRIDWNSIQLLTNNGGGFSYGVNGGAARSQGIEASLTIRPAAGVQFVGTFAYDHAVLTQDAPAVGGLAGDRLPYVPSLSGSFSGSYTHSLSADWTGTAGFGLRLVGNRLTDVTHATDSRYMAGYAALDLNASVTNGRYTFRLYAKNVSDKRAYSSITVLNNQATGAVTQDNATIIQPRTVGAAFDVSF